MGGIEGDIEEERLVVCLLFQKADGMIGKGICGVIWKSWRRQLGVIKCKSPTPSRLQVAGGSSQYAIEVLKPSLEWPFLLPVQAHMPFPRHVGMVTRIPKHLCHRHTITVQESHVTVLALVLGVFALLQLRVFRHGTYACLMGIEPREQAGTSGTRASAIIELREPESLGSQRINVGCRNLTTIATDVGIPHIICHNENDIRAFVCILCCPARNNRHQSYGRKTAFSE